VNGLEATNGAMKPGNLLMGGKLPCVYEQPEVYIGKVSGQQHSFLAIALQAIHATSALHVILASSI